jgi:hypothetical protein
MLESCKTEEFELRTVDERVLVDYAGQFWIHNFDVLGKAVRRPAIMDDTCQSNGSTCPADGTCAGLHFFFRENSRVDVQGQMRSEPNVSQYYWNCHDSTSTVPWRPMHMDEHDVPDGPSSPREVPHAIVRSLATNQYNQVLSDHLGTPIVRTQLLNIRHDNGFPFPDHIFQRRYKPLARESAKTFKGVDIYQLDHISGFKRYHQGKDTRKGHNLVRSWSCIYSELQALYVAWARDQLSEQAA